MDRRTTIRLEGDLKECLKIEAYLTGSTINSIVNRIIRDYFTMRKQDKVFKEMYEIKYGGEK
jgi:hypothetical protein